MKKYAIIVAGGKGTRMKTDVPKQFLRIDGVPIVVKTINRFLEYDPALEVILVLPHSHVSDWEQIQKELLTSAKLNIAIGGATRGDSVQSGLKLIDEEGLVAIHDAVRPFVAIQTIADSFESALKNGSGVAAVPLKDSIRELTDQGSIGRDRSNYVLVQTPQTFGVNSLKEAYLKVTGKVFTDDASVFEAGGFDVHLVDGSYENVKITTPDDLM